MATKTTVSAGVEKITLQALQLEEVSIRIVGTAPLVTHPFPHKSMLDIAIKQNQPAPKGAKKEYAIRKPYVDCLESCYVLSDLPKAFAGFDVDWADPRSFSRNVEFTEKEWTKFATAARFGFHVGGLKNAIADTAYDLKIIKKKDNIYGSVFIKNTEPDRIYGISCVPLINHTPPRMRVDCLSTFSSGADMRYRPEFTQWEMDIVAQFNPEMIDKSTLATLINYAGTMKGLGEYRSQKGGSWGSFTIKTT